MREERRFCAYFWPVGWWSISLGVSIDIHSPNIEIHLPFGFIRFGWQITYPDAIDITPESIRKQAIGWDPK